MTDPVVITARAVARRLEMEGRTGLRAEVEAVLVSRRPRAAPQQYTDVVALASLIVSVSGLVWTVYTDLRKRTSRPEPQEVVRAVRVRMSSGQDPLEQHVLDVVVTEAISVAGDHDDV